MFKIQYRGDYQICEYIPYDDGMIVYLQATKLGEIITPARHNWTFTVAIYLQKYEFGQPKLLNEDPVFVYEDILTYEEAKSAVQKIADAWSEDQPHYFYDVLSKEFYVFELEDE